MGLKGIVTCPCGVWTCPPTEIIHAHYWLGTYRTGPSWPWYPVSLRGLIVPVPAGFHPSSLGLSREVHALHIETTRFRQFLPETLENWSSQCWHYWPTGCILWLWMVQSFKLAVENSGNTEINTYADLSGSEGPSCGPSQGSAWDKVWGGFPLLWLPALFSTSTIPLPHARLHFWSRLKARAGGMVKLRQLLTSARGKLPHQCPPPAPSKRCHRHLSPQL